MHETFRRIITEGEERLEVEKEKIRSSSKSASEIVERAKQDMAALSKFAEDLPNRMMDKFSHVLTGDLHVGSPSTYAHLEFCGGRTDLRGLWGINDLKPGKYRAIVIIQKID